MAERAENGKSGAAGTAAGTYGHGQPCGPAAPSPFVAAHLGLMPEGGRVLDLAAGRGRHTALARAAGHPVTAVDREVEGLKTLRPGPDLEIVEADLENGTWPLDARTFAGVIVTNYLWRPILPEIVAAVAPGGVLIYETFAKGNERHGRPSNPDHLLNPGELLEAVNGELTVIAYAHGPEGDPPRAVRQRICAVRDV
ncbi:class I SAM-dependent methyltransferase [Hyphomicrobiales bacterium FT118]|uniref:Class I SAM-dependent methyltransferase n=2 Tax=Futiania mangrovi TaxID=2959716 RepID=A0A9J6PAM7_9PROT|nr:class I SAM-dependent methyltransferase [Futiania mangrovii]